MSPQEAIRVLDDAAARAKMGRNRHFIAQQAVRVLLAFVEAQKTPRERTAAPAPPAET